MQQPNSFFSIISAFLLSAGLLTIVQLKVKIPMLMLERFFKYGGWIEIILLSLYAAWLTRLSSDINKAPIIRRRIWLGFSIVFFGQLALGLSGLDKFLLSGQLHLPIPGMIIAAPVYRGCGFFMLILFTSTVLLTGPAWCSYLCYMGSWDLTASRMKKESAPLTRWRRSLRIALLVLFPAIALIIRAAGVPMLYATIAGLSAGILGVVFMLLWSRRTGVMTHCVSYCPIGLLANLLGKISPWRIRFTSACTDCLACSAACRYDALNKDDIKKRTPGLSCTLCGDCLPACPHNALEYRFLRINPIKARRAFLVLVISLHAVFLGIARI